MTIGAGYLSVAAQAILGPSHSDLVPSVLWLGWLDDAGALIATTGTSVTHAVFGPATDGVTTLVELDAGVAGDGWHIAALALLDAATDGQVIISAGLVDTSGDPTIISPDVDTPLSLEPGAVTFRTTSG